MVFVEPWCEQNKMSREAPQEQRREELLTFVRGMLKGMREGKPCRSILGNKMVWTL